MKAKIKAPQKAAAASSKQRPTIVSPTKNSPFDTEAWLDSIEEPDPFKPHNLADLVENGVESDSGTFDDPNPYSFVPVNLEDQAAAIAQRRLEWRQLLRGPLRPFLVALRLADPSTVGLPQWAKEAAGRVFYDSGGKDISRHYSLGWCIGFGTESIGLLAEWDVQLLEYAKPADELKRHLFHRAADDAMRDIAKAIDLLVGYREGAILARELDWKDYTVKCLLYIALKWQTLVGKSRQQVIAVLQERGPKVSNAVDRQLRTLLANIEFPRGRSGPKEKQVPEKKP